ncbi:hypothetical protein NOVO_06590 [Rickettsiales bacterium Ac37b]|nr:hypothetical protein NOVO_06590 [Rickettsiales bacterium Ac37b]
MTMTLSRMIFGPHHGFAGYYRYYKHVECNDETYRLPRQYTENFEKAMYNSYLEIKEKNLKAIDLGEQSGYKVPTSYGTFKVICANEPCGNGYTVKNILIREDINKLPSEEFINKYFDDDIKCLQICFNPSDEYVE